MVRLRDGWLPPHPACNCTFCVLVVVRRHAQDGRVWCIASSSTDADFEGCLTCAERPVVLALPKPAATRAFPDQLHAGITPVGCAG